VVAVVPGRVRRIENGRPTALPGAPCTKDLRGDPFVTPNAARN